MKSKGELRYLSFNSRDNDWGIVTTSVGYQFIDPNNPYPLIGHPDSYLFNNEGRILNEYQLVYIVKGSGEFTSKSTNKQHKISPGTMLLLCPDEWHNYQPTRKTGWHEYWVGFKGKDIDNRVKNNFLNKESPIFKIGINIDLIEIYKKIINLVIEDKKGYQQMASSMVLHLLGEVYYKNLNYQLEGNQYTVEKINEAKYFLRKNISSNHTAKDIAKRLNVSYSWFRQTFKKHTGVSPIQYQLQQKHLYAKELLSDPNLSITEVAYKLNFENVGQFSTFFKQREGSSPTSFRKTFL